MRDSAASRTRRAACCSVLGWARVVLVLIGLTMPAATVDAQLSPADSAAVVLGTATDFERQGRWEVAEALYRFLLDRYPGTPAADEARARLVAPASARLDPISRVELPVFATTYGLWLGVAVPLAFGAEDPEAYGAGLLVGGPVGLFSARAYQRANPLTEGQVRAISWGGIWGTWQGGGWAAALDIGVEEQCNPGGGCFESGDNSEELVASMVVGGLAGIATGAILARNPIRSGVSSAAQGGATWGAIYGAMGAQLFDPNSGDPIVTSALVTGNVGLVVGAALASKYGVSRSRVRMMNLGALLGGVGGIGVNLLVDPDNDDVSWLVPLSMSAAGLVIAGYNTRDHDGGALGGEEEPAGGGGALLSWREGRLDVGTPLPGATLVPVEDASGRQRWRPAMTFELFRARF